MAKDGGPLRRQALLNPPDDTVPATRSFHVDNRLVLSIAVPMTLAYLTTPLLGLVDTAVVGRLGDAALLGGLAAGAIVIDIVFASFNFLRTGTTGLVAQAFGRGDADEERAVFWRAAALATISGVAMILLMPLILWLGARFMAAEPAVTAAMRTYLAIRLVSAPFALVNYAVLGYVLGRGEATLGLALQILLNGANIGLSVLLGLTLGYGLAGVAWATVLAEVSACAVAAVILARRFRGARPLGFARIRHAPAVRAMLALNRDIMIRSFLLLGAFALFTRQGAQIDTPTLAANAILLNLFLVVSYFLDGFASAAEQLAGRAVGAHSRKAFDDAVRLTTVWGFALAGGVCAFFLAFGGGIIALLTTVEGVRALAEQYLPWAAFTGLSGVLAFQMDGVFIGATWSRDMRNMMLFSFAAYVAALLTLPALAGNHGLWAALHVFLIVRGLSLAAMVPVRRRQVFES